MTAARRVLLLGLMLLPLALTVVPTLLIRSLLPAGVGTMWPAFAALMALAGLVVVFSFAREWTQSVPGAVLATVAAIGLTLLGLIVLLFWALTGTTID